VPAIPVHHTPVDTESAWDADKNVSRIPNDAGESTLRKMYAWVDPNEDPNTKSAYKLPHHLVDADGKVGAASYEACVAAIAALNGARGGVDIPEADRQAVYNHLAAHIRDAGKEPPELKSRSQILRTDREVRMLTTPVELRAATDGGAPYIEGYALKFERWSDVLGWIMPFQEIISRSALDGADMSNVVALFNHDPNMPLARNTVTGDVGRLQLEVDGIGLRFKFTPTDTTYARDLMENVRAGVVNQCSFAFSVAEDDSAEEWTYDQERNIYLRRINKFARIYDISVVTSPAYPDTEAVVGQRSLERINELEAQRKRPNDDAEKEKLLLELDLLAL
jgi:HK97 family phage prohead protease